MKSPLNYLAAFALGCIFWIITGLTVAGYLSNVISLATFTVNTFLFWYRLIISVALLLSIVLTFYWFYFGSRDETVQDLINAKRKWYTLFFIQIIMAVVLLFALVLLFMNQGLWIWDYVVIFLALAFSTFIYFWVCSFFMSPREVIWVVLFK